MNKHDENLIDETRKTVSEQDYKEIRARWDKEDDLLSSRTGMFLTVNAILFAATQLQAAETSLQTDYNFFNIGVSVIGFILTLLWLKVSKRSYDCIIFLSQISKHASPVYMQKLNEFREPKRLFPTRVIAWILPLVVLLCWIVFAMLNIKF